MDLLQDFAQKDMIEQITILDEIKESGNTQAVPGLLDLYANPLGDQAVDEMVYHTLYGLLAGEEARIIQGLGHESPAVRLLCVRRAADVGSGSLKQALVEMLAKNTDPRMLAEIIRSLAGYKDSGLCETLLPFVRHDDYAVAAWAMKALAALRDDRVREAFTALINDSDDVKERASGCELRTAMAVENLASFGDEKTIDFLIGYIHHANPSFRRVVITSLSTMGEGVLPALERCLESGDKDEKIMAANIIGLTGLKQGADLLVSQFDQVSEPNLKFAMYEALGRIPSMRSIIGLNDGLAETDELVLLAVVTGLDHQCNPGVIKVVSEAVAKGDQQSDRIINAVVTGRATKIFRELYVAGGQAEVLMKRLVSGGDPEAVELFRGLLENIGSGPALADAKRLSAEKVAGEKRLLAADDSKAMLFFYKGVAADLGMEIVTAEDGKQAFEILQTDRNFHLIITDMNMPNMDGIELTRKVREQQDLAALPILMATTESEQSQTERAAAAGVNNFITKPFNKEDFKAKIAEMFK